VTLALFDGFAVSLGGLGRIHLRNMQPSDEAIFRDLYAEVRAAELAPVPWPAAQKRAFCDAQYTLQDQHYRTHYRDLHRLAVCRQLESTEAPVIGRLYLAHYETDLNVMDIALFARVQRQGFGSLLMREVVRYAEAHGETLRLHVEPLNPARRLYEKLGFVVAGEAGVYQPMVRRPGGTGA
jgi:ribosomal protein S18 acetylase RimI-like enzyme